MTIAWKAAAGKKNFGSGCHAPDSGFAAKIILSHFGDAPD
jgi:hypothetical protein